MAVTPRLSGAILAGGQARRLGGTPKGMLKAAGGEPIVGRLLRELACAGIEDVVIIANDRDPYLQFGKEVISDARPGHGPLGGIETALARSLGRSDAVLFVACDMPAITAKEFLALEEAFVAGQSRLVFAGTGDSFCHPLCAIVHNALLPEISSAIDEGRLGVQELWRRLGARSVHFDCEAPFFNINTPADRDEWSGTCAKPIPAMRVPASMAGGLRGFIAENHLSLEVIVDDGESPDAAADRPDRGRQSVSLGTSVTCAEARQIAGEIGISVETMGRLLNRLNVKIRRCELGCFG